jgi:hypothetical protein
MSNVTNLHYVSVTPSLISSFQERNCLVHVSRESNCYQLKRRQKGTNADLTFIGYSGAREASSVTTTIFF